jgi:hypothetical protein
MLCPKEMIDNAQYLDEYLRQREASLSIGASTARRMGPKGTIQIARNFLTELDLARFKKEAESEFYEELENTTQELMRELPNGFGHWGSARKFINIFLRGCCYNKFLFSHHGLSMVEPRLEVPLDSHVVKGLKAQAKRGALPRWKGVIHLNPTDSEKFQNFALTIAEAEGVNRVDLDVKYWRRMG